MSISPRWFPSSRIRNNMWAVSSMKSIFCPRKTILKLHCKGIFNTRWRQKVSLSFCEFLFIQILSGVCSQLTIRRHSSLYISTYDCYIFFTLSNVFEIFCHLSHLTLLLKHTDFEKTFKALLFLWWDWPVHKTADKITLVHDRSKMSRMVKDDPSER